MRLAVANVLVLHTATLLVDVRKHLEFASSHDCVAERRKARSGPRSRRGCRAFPLLLGSTTRTAELACARSVEALNPLSDETIILRSRLRTVRVCADPWPSY